MRRSPMSGDHWRHVAPDAAPTTRSTATGSGHPAGGCLRSGLRHATLRIMRLLLAALLAGLACVGASAQDRIYKVQTPDGRVLFTDRPPPGSKVLSEREVTHSPPAAAAGAERSQALQQQGAQAAERLQDRSAQIDRAFAAVQAAERDLADAKLQLEQGRTPLEGEMIATARGRVRQSPAYQERIAELEKGVVAAEQRLAKARADLTALR